MSRPKKIGPWTWEYRGWKIDRCTHSRYYIIVAPAGLEGANLRLRDAQCRIDTLLRQRGEKPPEVTYEKFYDENTTSLEGRNGRIYEGVVGWQYQVYVNGHSPDDGGRFDRLRDLKRNYPTARRA